MLDSELALTLPAGADLAHFAAPDGSSFWVSRFTLPANDLIEIVPEPPTLALLALLAWIILASRRARRSSPRVRESLHPHPREVGGARRAARGRTD